MVAPCTTSTTSTSHIRDGLTDAQTHTCYLDKVLRYTYETHQLFCLGMIARSLQLVTPLVENKQC